MDKTGSIKALNRANTKGYAGLDNSKKKKISELFYEGYDSNQIADKMHIAVLIVRHYLSNSEFAPPTTIELKLYQIKRIETALFLAIDEYRESKTKENAQAVRCLKFTYSTFVV